MFVYHFKHNYILIIQHTSLGTCDTCVIILTEARSCLDALLNPKITALLGHIQAVFVQNIAQCLGEG